MNLRENILSYIIVLILGFALSGCTLGYEIVSLDVLKKPPAGGSDPDLEADSIFGKKIPSSGPLCTDGRARSAIQVSSNRALIGGSFSRVGPCSGNVLRLASDGNLAAPLADLPRFNNEVYAAVSDGSGGWYVGGYFTDVAGVGRNGLVRIQSDGSVDSTFVPNVTGGGVWAILVHGNNVFIGGDFTTVNGVSRNFVAAVNKVTGVLDMSWNPNPDNSVTSFAVNSNSLYVAGDFSNISGQARKSLAAYQLSDLSLQMGWPVDDPCYSNGCSIRDVTANDSTVVFVYNGWSSTMPNLGILDAGTGLHREPPEQPSYMPSAVKIIGNDLFVAGSFRGYGQRTYGKKLDVSNGEVQQNIYPVDDRIVSVISDGNGGFFIAGHFTKVGSAAANGFAHINGAGEKLATYNATVANVKSMVTDGTRVIVGGGFSTVSGTSQASLAAIDSTGAAILSWTPNLTGGHPSRVSHVVLTANYLVVQGDFTHVDGQPRLGIAVFNRSDWSLNALTISSTGYISTTASSGDVLFLGGEFTAINSQPRTNLAALDLATGTVLPFNPSPNSEVRTLSTSADRLYVGGSFLEVSGQSRKYAASFDLTTLSLTTFDPFSSVLRVGYVARIREILGRVIIDAWNVRWTEGEDAPSITFMASYDKILGSEQWRVVFDQDAFSDANFDVAESGGEVYLGGWSFGIGTKTSYLAQVDIATLQKKAFDLDFDGAIYSLGFGGANELLVGGYFTKVGTADRVGLAKIDVVSGTLANWRSDIDGSPSTMAGSAGQVLVAGWFTTYQGLKRTGIFAVDTDSWEVTDWDLGLTSGGVNTMHLTSNLVVLGGSFSVVNGSNTIKNIASVKLSDGLLKSSWGPTAMTGYIYALESMGNRLFVAGEISSVDGTTVENLVELNLDSYQVVAPAAQPDGPIYSLATSGKNLYMGGEFENISGTPRVGLASWDLDLGALTNWAPNLGSGAEVSVIKESNGNLYVAGNFDDSVRENFIGFRISDHSTLPLILNTDDGISKMDIVNDRILFGGSFSQVNGTSHEYMAIWNMTSNSFETPSILPKWDAPDLIAKLGDKIFVSSESFTDWSRKYLMLYNAQTLAPADE